MKARRWLGHGPNFKRNIAISTESEAANWALHSTVTSSRLGTLKSLGGTPKIALLWVSSHKNIEVNKRAGRQASVLGNPSMDTVCTPLTTVKGEI